MPVCAALRAVGLEGAGLRAAALVAAGDWAAAEAKRVQRPLGRDSPPAPDFTRLLDEVAPALAAGLPAQDAPASRSISA